MIHKQALSNPEPAECPGLRSEAASHGAG